jgi:hypothetical protein
MGLFPDANVKNSPPDGFVFVVFIVFLLEAQEQNNSHNPCNRLKLFEL